MRILIATAGALTPDPVADFAARLVGDDGLVAVMTVIEVPRSFLDGIRSEQWHPLTDAEPDWTAGEDKVIAKYVEERGSRLTDPIKAALLNRGVEAETIFLESSDPADTIVRTAEDLDVDLIVMGATKRLFDETHWQSVTTGVTHDTARAVLVIPAHHGDDTGEMDLPTSEIEIV